MTKPMEPAATIIEVMGGTRAVSEIAGVHISQVNKWTWRRGRGGSEGLIPMKHARTLVAHSREHKLGLTPDHFFQPQTED